MDHESFYITQNNSNVLYNNAVSRMAVSNCWSEVTFISGYEMFLLLFVFIPMGMIRDVVKKIYLFVDMGLNLSGKLVRLSTSNYWQRGKKDNPSKRKQ